MRRYPFVVIAVAWLIASPLLAQAHPDSGAWTATIQEVESGVPFLCDLVESDDGDGGHRTDDGCPPNATFGVIFGAVGDDIWQTPITTCSAPDAPRPKARIAGCGRE